MARRQVLMSCVQYDGEIKSGAKSVLDMPEVASQLGLDGVEYREVYWHDRAAELPALVQKMQSAGLRTTFATFRTLFSADETVRAGLRQDLEDASSLGSTLLRVFRGVWPPEGEDGEAMWSAARALIKRAGELRVTLAIENFANTPGNKIADVVGIVGQLNPSIVGTNIDVSNYVINDEDPIAAVRALASRVRYVHLKDVDYGQDGKRTVTYLGAGKLPYREILAELEATGQDFPLCFEFGGAGNPEKALKESLAYLTSLGAR
jgi:sugar phosphate isomerase/epimerase